MTTTIFRKDNPCFTFPMGRQWPGLFFHINPEQRITEAVALLPMTGGNSFSCFLRLHSPIQCRTLPFQLRDFSLTSLSVGNEVGT
jgi:hypothetical protein